ncbi:unnamed protein product, partial [marine sediment metagenome]
EKGGVVLHEIFTKKETKVTDFDRFHDLEDAKLLMSDRINSQMKARGLPHLADLSVNLAHFLIKPNLTFNQRETEARKNLARVSVKPTYYKIKKGEMLVREGEC